MPKDDDTANKKAEDQFPTRGDATFLVKFRRQKRNGMWRASIDNIEQNTRQYCESVRCINSVFAGSGFSEPAIERNSDSLLSRIMRRTRNGGTSKAVRRSNHTNSNDETE